MNSYFEKQSGQNWIEFRDHRFHAEYEEVLRKLLSSKRQIEVTLRRLSDGVLFSLAQDSVYFRRDFQALGFWSSQSRKSEG